jgi:hypothetical protein
MDRTIRLANRGKVTVEFMLTPDGEIELWEIDKDGEMTSDQAPNLKVPLAELVEEFCEKGLWDESSNPRVRLAKVFQQCLAEIES